MTTNERLLQILLPEHPSGVYLLIRNLAFLSLCALFVVHAASMWTEYALGPVKGVPRTGEKPVQTQATGQDQKSASGLPDPEIIIRRNIFGGKAEEAKKKKENEIALDKIPLAEKMEDFKLTGTIVSSDDYRQAIIKNTKKNTEDFYREGETLKNARIKRILRNNVVVTLNNEDKVLSLDYKTRRNIEQKAGAANSAAENREEIHLNKARILSSLSNIRKVLRGAHITPHMQEGKAEGFHVTNIKNDSLFDRMALKNGDILLNANGEKINSPRQVMQMAEEIKSGNGIRLEILRNGRKSVLNYQFE